MLQPTVQNTQHITFTIETHDYAMEKCLILQIKAEKKLNDEFSFCIFFSLDLTLGFSPGETPFSYKTHTQTHTKAER